MPWEPSDNPNNKYANQAEKLWGGTVSSSTALAYDATFALIRAAEKAPNSIGVKDQLINLDVCGASGRIQFDNGNRKNPPQLLVKVIKDSKSQTGLAFKVSHDLTPAKNKCDDS